MILHNSSTKLQTRILDQCNPLRIHTSTRQVFASIRDKEITK